jgi:hypothetical protein
VPIRARLQALAPNPDIALAAAWCVRELDALCNASDVAIESAFASSRGRVVLQWVVELLRLDAIACTFMAADGTVVKAINDLVGDLRTAYPGVTHDPTGCLVYFAFGPPIPPLETFVRDGFKS